ncbi:12494_t:CDS:2, partial [Acaulospora morrowiae]
AEMVHLWLRAETKPKEHRAALTPSTCQTLFQHGFQITVEKSKERIFDDEEYEKVGCVMVPMGTWRTAPLEAYIVGLKELPENDDSPLSHSHIFFAHCYKNQDGWKEIIRRFVKGNGIILDMEFLTDEKNRRVAAFGYHAGFSGTALGLDVWAQQRLDPKQKYPEVLPYPNENGLISHIKSRLESAIKLNQRSPRVMVMGALGRCGRGATDFASKAGIPEENIIKWDIEETKRGGPFPEILESDVFVNCIYLNQKIPPFITKEFLDKPRQLSVVVDVSCDTTNPNNPLPIYTVNTTFGNPTVSVETKNPHPLEVISIDHLPTLLPRESSEQFSRDLLPSLLQLSERDSARVWVDAEKLFREKASLIDL